MKDGSYYEGDFNEGEISGKGYRRYNDGTIYKGEFKGGERHGYGENTYDSKVVAKYGEWYKGEWVMNIR